MKLEDIDRIERDAARIALNAVISDLQSDNSGSLEKHEKKWSEIRALVSTGEFDESTLAKEVCHELIVWLATPPRTLDRYYHAGVPASIDHEFDGQRQIIKEFWNSIESRTFLPRLSESVSRGWLQATESLCHEFISIGETLTETAKQRLVLLFNDACESAIRSSREGSIGHLKLCQSNGVFFLEGDEFQLSGDDLANSMRDELQEVDSDEKQQQLAVLIPQLIVSLLPLNADLLPSLEMNSHERNYYLTCRVLDPEIG